MDVSPNSDNDAAERARIEERVAALEADYVAVDAGLAKLNEDIARLEAKLADAKARQKALVMRHQTASHRLEVRKKIHENRIDDALVRFEQYERKMENIEGRVEAFDLGQKKDLSRELSDLAHEESVEAALADLKQRIDTGKSEEKTS